MAICNCKNNRCTCLVTGGFGIDVSGNGSGRNPYVASALPWTLTGSEGEAAEVVVEGSGSVGDPYVVSVETDGQTVTRSVFTTDGTWVNPGTGSIAHVICIGGGGGGMASRSVTGGDPGGGGGGGAMSTGWFLIADLPGTVNVGVGAGGTAGTGGLSPVESGRGGWSWFGDFLIASSGGGSNTMQFEYVPYGGGIIGTPPEGGYGGMGAHLEGGVRVGPGSIINSLASGGGGLGWSPTNTVTNGSLAAITDILVADGGEGGKSGIPPVAGGNYGGGGGGGGGDGSISQNGAPGAPGIVIVTTW